MKSLLNRNIFLILAIFFNLINSQLNSKNNFGEFIPDSIGINFKEAHSKIFFDSVSQLEFSTIIDGNVYCLSSEPITENLTASNFKYTTTSVESIINYSTKDQFQEITYTSALMTTPSGYIKFADLRGVAGNPQWDSLSICGNCDTISIFIVTNSDSVITNNRLTVNLPDGLLYCGEVGSESTIGVSEANVSNTQSPEFFIPDINSGNGVQVWFTVEANCEAVSTLLDPVDNELLVDFRMDYTDPSGNPAFDLFFPPRSYNNAVMIPVLNILDIEDQTLAGVPIIGTLALPNSYKQKISISQNGLGAYLEDFFLEADYTDAAHTFVSMTINGVDVTSKVIDDGDKLQVFIDSTDFATNPIPMTFPNLLEEGEQLMVEIVWEIDFCLDANVEVNYNVFYACDGTICDENTSDERVAITPVDGTDYNISITTAGAHPTVSVCGNRSRTIVFNNNSANIDSDVFDIGLEFSVGVGNLCNVDDVRINGVSVFAGYGGSPLNVSRASISLDNVLTSDPDGAGGIDDLDGDGYFDDLPESSNVPFEFSVYLFPANLNQNQNFNLGFGVQWQNFFLSPSSSCSNYSLEYELPIPNGIQVNSATWGGAAIPAANINIVNDTLYITTQSINRTNIATQTNLIVNMTNLLCVNDIIDWTPITYLNCDDVLPDCGCRIPLNNTPEATFCTFTRSTVRLGCTCDWVNTTKYDVSRTSFGYTDKNMTSMVDENTPGVSLNNFVSCDSFFICTEGVIRGDGYDSLKLHIGQNSSLFLLDSLVAEFEVVDVSTGTTISGVCGILNKNRSDDQISFQDPFVIRTIFGYEFDLSDCLSQPLDLGDTVRLTGYGVIANVNSTGVFSPTINQAIWSVYDDAPDIMDFMECNAINDRISNYNYAMHGIGEASFSDFCTGSFTGLITPGANIFSTSNTNGFPNEFRVVNALDSIVVCTEGEVDETSFMIRVADSGLIPVVPSRTYLSGANTCYVFEIDPAVYPPVCTDFANSGDTLAMFTFNHFRNCASNDVITTDVGTFYNIYYRHLGNLENNPNCFNNRIDNVNGTNEIIVTTPPPPPAEIRITVAPFFQTATSGNFCFDVRVENTGGSEAPITWLGLENLSGFASYASVTKNPGAVNLNILPVGAPALNQALIDLDEMLEPGAFVDLEVCLNAASCGVDTIGFYSGWECARLPSDIQIASYDQFTCPSVYEEAYFEILDPQLQLDFTEPVSGEVSYCTPTEYTIEIKNVRQGPAFLDSIFVYLPLGSGFQFAPGSFTLEWPVGGAPVPIADPVATGVSDLFMGNQFVLTDLAPPLDVDQTLPGISADPTTNRVFLRFEGVPTCSYQEGSIMQFQASGTNICGESIFSNLNTSPRISLFGLDTFIVNDYLVFLEPSRFSTCEGQEIFEANILNEGPFPTSPDELVCITIPDTIPLVPGSFNFFNPSTWNPSIVEDSVGVGVTKYCFFMPAGVPEGGVFSFNFEVDVDEDTPCGIYPFFLQTLFEQERVCEFFDSQEDCSLRINTSLNTEFGVNLISALASSNINVNWDAQVCGSSDPMVTYQMNVTNNNLIDDFPAGQASVRIFGDVDNDGMLDLTTDSLIGADQINQVILAGETIQINGAFDFGTADFCLYDGFILELSDNAGCECGSESFPIEISNSNLFGSSLSDTIELCRNNYDGELEIECTESNPLFGDISNNIGVNDFFDTNPVFSSLTDGAGNPLIVDEYFSFGIDELDAYFEKYENGSGDTVSYAYLFYFGEYIQCSPDGIFKATYEFSLSSDPTCTIPFTLTLNCSAITLTNTENDVFLCGPEDSICVNIFDHFIFEDIDGNIIDPTDPSSGFDFSRYDFIRLLDVNNSFFALQNISLDTVGGYADLSFELCITDEETIRMDLSSNSNFSCFNSLTARFKKEENDPNFTFNLEYPEEICLGDEAVILNNHTGIFEGISVVSGDMLTLPICNNLTVCDTIRVSPTIATTYLINLTDSVGCSSDTMFTIGVRDTESPLIVTVDDNLLCDGSAETAMVCVEDPRAATIFTWQRDGIDIPGTTGMTCITVNNSGIYSITATDDLGCSLSGENSVFIQPSPEPLILLFGDTTFCVGIDTLTIATTLGFETYTWFQITGGTSTPIANDVNTIEFSGLGTHSFYVEVTDLQGCAATSDTLEIEGKDCFIDLELEKDILDNGVTVPDNTSFIPGDTVTYIIILENRTLAGDSIPLDARGVVVNDDLPAGVTYISSTTTLGTYDPVTGDWDIGFMRNGRIDTLLIETRLDSATTIFNLAEVTEHEENDIDSEPDNAGSAPVEDDEAFKTIEVGKFDLALIKEVFSPAPYYGGNDVTFEITVYNQGSIDATNVVIQDYIPLEMQLNDGNWTSSSPQVASRTIPFIGKGDSTTLSITLSINSGFVGQSINNAEIVAADGGIDEDDPLTNINDGTTNELPTDNNIDDSDPGTPGTMDFGGDEDDYDPALIIVDCPPLPATTPMFIRN